MYRASLFGASRGRLSHAYGISAILCVSGSLVSIAAYCIPTRTAIDLEVTPAGRQNLGLVRQDSTKSASFTIRNASMGLIRLLGTTTSCSCTSANLGNNELKPGESTSLEITFHSGSSRGDFEIEAILGYQKANDPSLRTIVLRGFGTIDPDYDVEPSELTFDNAEPLSKRVLLTPRHIDSLAVSFVVCDKRFFTAHPLAASNSGSTEIEVTFHSDQFYADAGPAHLVIHTDSIRQPIVTLPLRVVDRNTDAHRDKAPHQEAK